MLQDERRQGEPSLEEILAERIAEKVALKVVDTVVDRLDGGPEWLSLKEAATYIGMDYSKFTKHVREGEIPSHEIFGIIKINRRELDTCCKSFPGRYR